MKLDGIKGIVIVFSSGAMISVGSKSIEDAERDLTVAYYVILNGMKHLRERTSIRIDTEKVKSQRPQWYSEEPPPQSSFNLKR